MAVAGSPPEITQQPADQIVIAGSQVTISVKATSAVAGLDAVFEKSTDGGVTWNPVAGCGGGFTIDCGISPTLQVADNGSQYRVVVTNATGTTISRVATMTVCSDASCVTATLSVTPDTGLLSGQLVTVSGSDFPASAQISLATCIVGQGMCRGASTVTSSTIGDFSTPFAVSRVVGRSRDCLHWGCEVRARINGAVFGRAPISFFPVQPDAQVRRRSDGTIFFDNIYPLTPPFGNAGTQTRSHSIEPGGKWTYAVRIQNDGPVTDDITVQGPGSPLNFFRIRYFVGYFDVTEFVAGDGFRFVGVDPGETHKMTVQFSATEDAPGGMDSRMRFTSGIDPAAADELILRVVV